MKYFPQKLWQSKVAAILLILVLSSCAGRSTTKTNIKKINDALLETQAKKKAPPEKKPEPPKTPEQSNGPVPMSTFMSPPPKNVIASSNRWFPRVQSWAKIYREIAKQEQDVRNYSLSARYSIISLLWANRSLEIKDLTNDKAIIKIQLWISQIKLPELPEEPTYFAGQDAYKKISETRKILEGLDHRFCLISEGVQFIPALAYLEISSDLLDQKKYAKAMTKIQSGFGLVETTDKEKATCETTNPIEPK
jgi:hypothetical protein